jgi:hypothetical protein
VIGQYALKTAAPPVSERFVSAAFHFAPSTSISTSSLFICLCAQERLLAFAFLAEDVD